jgi:hypothetical protein
MGDQNAWLVAEYKPLATYFPDADCAEYVAEDTVCVHERIDEFLTLIWDETRFRTIGFKLKGFRWIFEQYLSAHYQLNEGAFLKMVAAIEAVCQKLGDEVFADERRAAAYRAARKIAAQNDVELIAPEFQKAA